MIYKGILPKRKTWVKALGVLLAGLMLYREVINGQLIYVPIAILVILACFIKKEHIISEKGVDIKHTIFNLPIHNYWSWEEITTLHTDYRKARPNVMLHIGKDVVVRSYVMKPSDCQDALKLAGEMNPNIYIKE